MGTPGPDPTKKPRLEGPAEVMEVQPPVAEVEVTVETSAERPQRRGRRERRPQLNLTPIFTALMLLFGINVERDGITVETYSAIKACAWLIRQGRKSDGTKYDKEKELANGKKVTTRDVLTTIAAHAGAEMKGNDMWYQTRDVLAEALVHGRNMKSFAGLTTSESKGKNAPFMPSILPAWVGDKVPGSMPLKANPMKGKKKETGNNGGRRRPMTRHRRLDPIGRAFGMSFQKGMMAIPKGNQYFQESYVYACFGNIVAPLGAIDFKLDIGDEGFDVAQLLAYPVETARKEPGLTVDMWGILATAKSQEKGFNTYYVMTPNGVVAKKQEITGKGKGLGYGQLSIYSKLQDTYEKMINAATLAGGELAQPGPADHVGLAAR